MSPVPSDNPVVNEKPTPEPNGTSSDAENMTATAASSTDGTAIPTPATTEADTETSADAEKHDDTDKTKDLPPGTVSEIKSVIEIQKNGETEIIERDAYLKRDKRPFQQYALVARQVYDDKKDKFVKTVVEINSPQLLRALKETVDFYPADTLKFDKRATFDSPFMLLNHYETELRQYAEKNDDETTKQHMELLLHFLENEAGERGVEIKKNISAGLITFDSLWTIYRPGDLLYESNYGHARLYRLEKADYQDSESCAGKFMELACAYTTCDGTNAGQALVKLKIWEKKEFVGLSPSTITRLSVVPLKLMPEQDTDALKEELIERGKRYLEIRGVMTFDYQGLYMYLKTPPWDHYDEESNYNGTWLPRTANERIVVDTKTFVEEMREQKEEYSRNLGPQGSGSEESNFHRREVDPMLCPPHVYGFSLETKEWCKWFVDNLKPITWQTDAMNTLILEEPKRRLVRSLVTSHCFPEQARNEAAAKGKGLIILLHGTPGSGKTLTAELTAEQTQRPLLKISTGELGSWEYRISHELKRLLTYASIWHAIVLIDEADVFLEARQSGPERFEQNNLVAVFLRQLEYFQGILFITSNRVGVFDDAIRSRIHLALQYEAPDQQRRKELWQQCLHKLVAEKEAETATDDELDALSRPEMNGREISNAVNTARTLAAGESGKLKLEHLLTVVEVWNSFQTSLNKMQAVSKVT